MSWEYRVIKVTSPHGDCYEIRSVYYEPLGWSLFKAVPGGDTLEEVREDLARMAEALEKPLLILTEEMELREEKDA